jgi:hypothetical protein
MSELELPEQAEEEIPSYLKDVLDILLPRITEKNFLKDFFPLILAQEFKVFAVNWVAAVAKSYEQRVQVVDDAGNSLFTVPPLCDILNYSSDKLGVELFLAKREMETSPALGLQKLTRTITDHISIESTVNENYQHEWVEIYKRYGKEHLLVDYSSDTTQSQGEEEENPLLNYNDIE